MKKILCLALAFSAGTFALAQKQSDTTPMPATRMLRAAQIQAEKEHKTVMVRFHASWCGWCHKFDDWLARPEVKAVMSKYFVFVNLDVLETADKKNLENPGAEEKLKQWGGDKQGIPYTVLLNFKGEVIINSLLNGKSNIGFPYEASEIAHFMKMMEKGAPKMSQKERDVLQAQLNIKAQAKG